MASRSQIRAVKRRRWERSSDWDDPSWVGGELLPVPAGPHAPNSNEARVLRRLMSQTGLSEAELREHKCYRVALSEAQVQRGTKTPVQRAALKVRKRVTQELQLPREHPRVKEAFIAAWPGRFSALYRGFVPVSPELAWAEVQRL